MTVPLVNFCIITEDSEHISLQRLSTESWGWPQGKPVASSGFVACSYAYAYDISLNSLKAVPVIEMPNGSPGALNIVGFAGVGTTSSGMESQWNFPSKKSVGV